MKRTTNKSDKFGIKVWFVADVGNKYFLMNFHN